MNTFKIAGHCGESVVKNYINTVQFLAQTIRFVSLDLNVSSRAAGVHLVLSMYVFFFTLISVESIECNCVTDRLQRFEFCLCST